MSELNQNLASIAAIYRYPVKGFSPQSLVGATLVEGRPIAFDRAWAIESGSGRFDATSPKYLPKTNFVMLMRHEALASLETIFDETTLELEIRRDGKSVACGRLSCEAGRQKLEDFILNLLGSSLRGPPRVVWSEGHSFSDVAAKCLHVVNKASLDELEHATGRKIDELRFRPNLVVDGWPAWREFELLGKQIAIGEARLKVFKRTMRCAATNVDPTNGARDLEIPEFLKRKWGHADFGIYAKVTHGGDITSGDEVTIEP